MCLWLWRFPRESEDSVGEVQVGREHCWGGGRRGEPLCLPELCWCHWAWGHGGLLGGPLQSLRAFAQRL